MTNHTIDEIAATNESSRKRSKKCKEISIDDELFPNDQFVMKAKRKKIKENMKSGDEATMIVDEEKEVKRRKKHAGDSKENSKKSEIENAENIDVKDGTFASTDCDYFTAMKGSTNKKKKLKHVEESEKTEVFHNNEILSDDQCVVKKKKSKSLREDDSSHLGNVSSISCSGKMKEKKRKNHEDESIMQKSKKSKSVANNMSDEVTFTEYSKKGDDSSISKDEEMTTKKMKKHKSSSKKKIKSKEFVSEDSKYLSKDEKSESMTEEKDLSVFEKVAPKNKSIKSIIPDSMLSKLLQNCDQIIEEDRKKQLSIAEEEEACSDESQQEDHNEEMESSISMNDGKLIEESLSKEEEEELTYYDSEKLKTIQFGLPFDLPIIHKIAHFVCTRPTSEQRKDIEDAGIKLKVGKYTKEEDQKIKDNWKLFCKIHGWDEENYMPFVKGSTRSKYGVLTKNKFKTFVKFISHNFEDRLMYNIYVRFQRLFSPNHNVYRMFTSEEDKIILSYVNKHKHERPYLELSNMLKRPRIALLKRYKQLQEQKVFEKEIIIWDEYRTKQLIVNLLKVTGSENLEALKDHKIAAEEWKKISKKMAIPEAKIKGAWSREIYTRVFDPDFLEKFEDNSKKLIQILSEKYNDFREIDWKELAKQFDSYTHQRLYRIFNDLITTKVPKEDRKNFKACLECLKHCSADPKHLRFNFMKRILAEIEAETS